MTDGNFDVVNHPAHYTHGKYEAIDVIEDSLCPEFVEGFLAGNVLKYMLRYRYKDGLTDLRKARWYLDRLIDRLEEVDDEQRDRQDEDAR